LAAREARRQEEKSFALHNTGAKAPAYQTSLSKIQLDLEF
jgi:hypothetical protein